MSAADPSGDGTLRAGFRALALRDELRRLIDEHGGYEVVNAALAEIDQREQAAQRKYDEERRQVMEAVVFVERRRA